MVKMIPKGWMDREIGMAEGFLGTVLGSTSAAGSQVCCVGRPESHSSHCY